MSLLALGSQVGGSSSSPVTSILSSGISSVIPIPFVNDILGNALGNLLGGLVSGTTKHLDVESSNKVGNDAGNAVMNIYKGLDNAQKKYVYDKVYEFYKKYRSDWKTGWGGALDNIYRSDVDPFLNTDKFIFQVYSVTARTLSRVVDAESDELNTHLSWWSNVFTNATASMPVASSVNFGDLNTVKKLINTVRDKSYYYLAFLLPVGLLVFYLFRKKKHVGRY